MALSWFQRPEAQSILKALGPQDIFIKKIPAHGLDDRYKPAHFEWRLHDEDIMRRLEVFVDRATDEEVGFAFKTANEEDAERWLDINEKLPSIQAFLNSKFGDPQVFWGSSEDEANRLYRIAPHHPIRHMELRNG